MADSSPIACVRLLVVAGAALLSAGCGQRAVPTYAQFLHTLAVPDRLARLDTPQSELVSSYDPSGGNDDFNNFAGREGTNWAVLADLRGPGWVSRFWTTGGASAGQRLQFYFDGERQPRIDATVAELRRGEVPFILALSRYEQSCWYSFVPMPFRKRLRILAQTDNFTHEGWPRLFFQLNWSRLPDAASAPVFPAPLAAADRAALESYGNWLEGRSSTGMSGATNLAAAVAISPGQEATILEWPGAGVVRELRLEVQPAGAAAAPAVDRGDLTLRMRWDGQTEPSVSVPFDAFFGKLWGSPDFGCAFLSGSGAVARCRLPMPYRMGGRISVSNSGPRDVRVTADMLLSTEPPDAALGYLHAVWHRSGPQDRGQPHLVVRAQGRGKIAGCLLGVSSAVPSWWALEGDESIRIDGEAKPGWLGTGLEDYFSGAWYYKNNLVRPQHGLVFKRPFVTVQYRFHQMDARCFQQGVEMVFERGPDQNSPAWMSSVGYYYLAQPTRAAAEASDTGAVTPPRDDYEADAVMGTLCNFERLDDYAGASAYIDRYLREHPAPFADILRLRQIAYRERVDGIEAARPAYEDFLRTTTNEPAVGYARLLLWFHEGPSHALLSLNCGVPTRAYLDGAVAGETGNPQAFVVFPVTLAPGPHVLSLQAFRGPQPEWVQACLRTHRGLVATDPAWTFAFNPTGDWHAPDHPADGWLPTGDSLQEGPPPLPYVATTPHPFVDMQSRAWGIWANGPWPERARSVGFRTRFEMDPLPVGVHAATQQANMVEVAPQASVEP